MNLFSFGGIIGDAIADMWMSIWLSLNNLVYNIIEVLYRVFETVAKINLFSDQDYKLITGRVYVIMGIAMLFILAYNLILMIINPEDKKGTGQMTKMVKEIIISLILIVLLPRIFNYMAIFQRHILDSNILGQIIIGDTGGTVDVCDYDQYDFLGRGTNIQNTNSPDKALNDDCTRFTDDSITSAGVRGAHSIAPTLFSAFYHPTNYGFTQCQEYYKQCRGEGDGCQTPIIYEDNDKEMCKYYFHDVKKAVFTGSLKPFNEDSFFYSKVKKNEETFEFNYLLAFVAGCLAVYMFVCYTIAIGVRVAKLGFFQIVSPIAVMMRIIPKQKEAIFDKWLKNLKDAYLDVFIRLAIIYFALFAISLVPGVIDNMGVDADGNFMVWLLAKVVLILGILKFAQDAPGLLKEFFGNSGTFALKSPKKQWEENKLASKGVGMIAGGIGGAAVGLSRNLNRSSNESTKDRAWSGTRGLFGGLYHGARNGIKNGSTDLKGSISSAADSVEEHRQTYNARRASGSYFKGLYEEKLDSAKRSYSDFKDYMKGEVASSELGNAASAIMSNIDGIESTFSNANIKNIEAGRSEIMKKFNADQDFDFNGKKYHKINENEWSDGTNTIKHGDLGKVIADSFKDRLAAAYANNEMKPGIKEGFERANESLLKNLRDSMPKLGDGFSEALFKNLNKLTDIHGNNMNLNVKSLDDLEARMKTLMATEEGRASIYKINDEIKSVAKGIKLENDQALKAQQAKKEQSKKSDGNK